jgi:nucleotide-binding universal stress UspA family protein
MRNQPIVVGVDGSPESMAATEIAAREAVLRGVPLRVVHAFIWPYMRNVPLGPSAFGPEEGGLKNQAQQVVDDGVARAKQTEADLDVSGEVVVGSAAQVLIAASGEASMIVVGDRGLGAFAGLLVGSVSVHVATHAACPVLVVRGESGAAAPVLVGVDGSPAADNAVGFAFEEATLRGVPLLAVHAWRYPTPAYPGEMQPIVYDESIAREDEERIVEDALAKWRAQYPGVRVQNVIVHGGVRRTVLDATGEAQLAVFGTRGHGGFTGLLLGSVSQAALHHSACPVVIVPSTGP